MSLLHLQACGLKLIDRAACWPLAAGQRGENTVVDMASCGNLQKAAKTPREPNA